MITIHILCFLVMGMLTLMLGACLLYKKLRVSQHDENKKQNPGIIITTSALVDDILAALPDAVFLIDDRHIIIKVNRAAENMLGYQSAELIGQGFAILMDADDDNLIFQGRINIELQETGSINNLNLWFQAKNNQQVPVEITLTQIREQSQGKGWFICVAHDITKRHRNETEIDRLKTELRHTHSGSEK